MVENRKGPAPLEIVDPRSVLHKIDRMHGRTMLKLFSGDHGELLQDKFLDFEQHVRSVYSERDAAKILQTFHTVTVLYQNNENDTEGLRKREDHSGRRPFIIEHSLAITTTLAGMRREVPITFPDGEVHTLVVKQNPMNAAGVCAALWHDVKEDVKFERVEGDQWDDVMRAHFGDYEHTEDIVTLVNAVTKVDRSTAETFKKQITKTDLYKKIIKNVRSLEQDTPEEEIEMQVVRTLLDMQKLYETTLGKPGSKPDDHAFKLFFTAFAIKAHDIENNLETSVKSDKLIRAHIFAVMARVLGLPVASRLAVHLIANNRYGIEGDVEHISEDQWDVLRSFLHLEADFIASENTPEISIDGNKLDVAAIQLPILTRDELKKRRNTKSFAPQFLLNIKEKDQFDSVYSSILGSKSEFDVSVNGLQYRARKITARIHDMLRGVRKVAYVEVFELVENYEMLKAILRVDDGSPTAHQAIKYRAPDAKYEVPEINRVSERELFLIKGKKEEGKREVRPALDVYNSFYPL